MDIKEILWIAYFNKKQWQPLQRNVDVVEWNVFTSLKNVNMLTIYFFEWEYVDSNMHFYKYIDGSRAVVV